MGFRRREHLAHFCGSLQPHKCLQSTRRLQGAVLKARASFFAVTLPLTFHSEAGGKRSWAMGPGPGQR